MEGMIGDRRIMVNLTIDEVEYLLDNLGQRPFIDSLSTDRELKDRDHYDRILELLTKALRTLLK